MADSNLPKDLAAALSLKKIFLSGTFIDLKPEREAAAKELARLGLDAVTMPQPASPKAPANASLELLSQCDAVILIVGDRYGAPLPDTKLSITEMEYDRAVELEIPVLAFLVQRPWWQFWKKFAVDYSEAGLRDRFIRKLQRDVTYRELSSSNLGVGITEALSSLTHPTNFIPARRYFRNRLAKAADPLLFAFEDDPIGRRDDIQRLDEFLKGTKPFLFLDGPQGIGKSHLLWLHSEKLRATGWWVGFWTGTDATQKTLQDLLADSYEKGVAYIDYGPEIGLPLLRTLLLQFLRTKFSEERKVKFVIGVPDRSKTEMRTVLGDLFSEDQSDHLSLKPLADTLELRNWIERKLKKQIGAPAIADLIKKTNGFPLLIKAGIRLLDAGQISTTELAHSEGIQDLYLKTSLDSALRQSTRPEKLKQWLWVAAVLSPFYRNDDQVQRTGAAFLKIERWEWIDLLEEAEASSLVERIGRYVRVTPEIFADYLVDAACFGVSGDIRADYVAGVLDAFLGLPFDNRASPLITNLAQSEYRNRTTSLASASKNPLWTVLAARFSQSGLISKCDWLEKFKNIAVYAPEWALNLCEEVLAHARQMQPEEVWPGSGMQRTAEDLIERLAPVLIGVALHPEFFDRATDILWRLRLSDSRPTNQFTDHPARLLDGLAEIKLGKPVFYSEQMIARVREWVKWPETQKAKISPLAVTATVLSKELEVAHWLPGSISLGFRLLNPSGPIIKLRDQFRKLLEACAKGVHGNWLIQESIDLLCDDAAPPRGMMGMNITKEMHKQWEGEQAEALGTLGRVAASKPEPIACVWIWNRLEWIASHHPSPAIRTAADQIRANVSKSPDFDLYRVLLIHASDLGEHDQTSMAKAILAQVGDASDLLKAMADLHAKLASFDADTRGLGLGGLVFHMGRENPRLGLAAGRLLLETGPKDMLFLVMGLIASARENAELFPEYLSVVKDAIKENVEEVIWQLPNWYRAYAVALHPEEWPIVECIVRHPKARRNTLTFYTLRELARHPEHRRRAKAILLGLPATTDDKLADSICEIFDEKEGLRYSDLTKAETSTLLTKFLKVPKFEYNMHWIGSWFTYVGRVYPEILFKFFVFRIRLRSRISDPVKKTNFRPIPHSLAKITPLFKETPEGERKPMIARLLALCASQSKLRYDARELFWHVVTWDLGLVATALQEALEDGRIEVDTAVWLLDEAPEEFVAGERLGFMDFLLRKAKAQSEKAYDRARAALVNVATSGESVRTPGQSSDKFLAINEFAKAGAAGAAADSPLKQYFEDLKRVVEDRMAWERLSDVEAELE